MKKTVCIAWLLVATLSLHAQDLTTDTLPPSAGPDSGITLPIPAKRLQTNVTIGTQFSTSSWFGSGLTTYIAPTLTYRVSPRFSVRGGLAIANTSLFDYRPWFSTEGSSTYDANFTRAILYLEGSYRVTDKLTISGAGFKEFTITDNSRFYNPYTQNEPYGIYLNADYRISDNVHIQAGFGYTKGYSPFMGTPYTPIGTPFTGGAFYSSPFQPDPFHSGPTAW